MTDDDVRQAAEEVHDLLPDGVEASPDDVEGRLTTLVSDYQVPLEEARRSVITTYLDETEVDFADLGGEDQVVDIADIDAPEQWVTVTAKVVDLWEPRSDAVAQVGLLGDETGTIKFTKWAKSALSELGEGRVYRLGNVVTDEYQGRYSVKLNRTTTIEAVDIEMEVGDNTTEAVGALVDVQSGSGLIKRCTVEECTRVLQNGRCGEHGEVDGEFDLRIKGVLDDGTTIQEVIFDRAATAQAADITLDEAQEMAMDALDTDVVADEVREATIGRYYRVEGPEMGRYLVVNEFEQVEGAHDPDELLVTARSM